MPRNVTITLVEDSTAGNPPKIYAAQHIDIAYESDTVTIGADGITSAGSHPSTIFWRGGKAKDLKNITDVKIVANTGEIIVHGGLHTNYEVPLDVADGVKFLIRKPD